MQWYDDQSFYYYELLALSQPPRQAKPNACTHKPSENSNWGCVAMCKTHSTNPYPVSGFGDGRYHECIGQQNLLTTPVCTCVFLPITITIDGVDTKWYKRPSKTHPAA